MKFEKTEVWGFKHALRGMRNPLESWDKSDSEVTDYQVSNFQIAERITVGENDLELAQRLVKAGSEHRKFMRQIFVSVDITAPLYWWKEFDTYKVGTVANSTSTMHKLASTPITVDCFEMDDFDKTVAWQENELEDWDRFKWFDIEQVFLSTITNLEKLRRRYNKPKDKRYWKELIRLLPESWLQKRTVTMNYENLYSIVRHRKNHKLTEWSVSFIEWVKSLPYAEELIFIGMEER